MPLDVPAALLQAKRLMKEGDYDNAWSVAQSAKEAAPTRSDVLNLNATIAFIRKDFANAIAHFKLVHQLSPSDPTPMINIGAVHNRAGEFKEALAALQKVVHKFKTDGSGYYNLAMAYRGLGQSKMAVTAYREALRIDPANSDAHMNLANLFVEIGNYPQAILHYQKAIEVRPDFERARKGLAHAQHLNSHGKDSASPFGRLVDAERLNQQSSESTARALTDDERLNDRHKLKLLTYEVRHSANTLLEHIKESLLPSLLTLNRGVSRLSDDPYTVERAFVKWKQSVADAAHMRKELKRKMLEVRAHEEMMNIPEIPGGSLN